MFAKKFAFALTCAALWAGAAEAADLPTHKAPTPPPPAPAFSWAGLYLGGNLGGKWANTAGSAFIPAANGFGIATPAGTLPFTSTFNPTPVGGGQLGYNWQFGQTVFGLEADVDAQHWRASRTAIGPGLPGIFVTGDSFTATSDWQAAFKGRLGYAFDQNLLYVTGGLALTDIAVGTNFVATTVGRINFPASSATDTKTLAGATVGAGWERALTRNWSIGLESRYSWYGTHTYNGGQVAAIGNANAAFVNVPTTQTLRLDTVEALVRINYHF